MLWIRGYIDMVCKNMFCTRHASYIVTNPDKGLDERMVKENVYCLQHARQIFRSDVVIFTHGVKMYKVELIAQKE